MQTKVNDSVKIRLGNEVLAATVKDTRFGRLKVDIGNGEIVTVTEKDLVAEGTPESLIGSIEPAALPGMSLPASYAADSIKPLDFESEEAQSFMISDEWTGSVERGDIFREAAQKYIDYNPDKEFRWLGPEVVKRFGRRDYKPVINPENGQVVRQGQHELGWIPKPVYAERQRRKAADAEERQQVKAAQTQEIIDRAVHDSHGGIRVTQQTAERKF